MESKHVLALLAVIVIVEAFVIGYLAVSNSSLKSDLEQLQSNYEELLNEYNQLMAERFPVTLVDDFGRVVTVSSEPTRIVSLAPSSTEILFALGLGDRVVGVTEYCDYPPEVVELKENGSIAVVGGYTTVDVEAVLQLQPDLVVASTSLQRDVVTTLEGYGLTVIALDPHDLSEMFADIILVGRATGKLVEAQQLVQQLESRVQAVVNKVKDLPKLKVYYELWYNPLMSVGPGTFIDSLITMAGGENIFSDASTQYPMVSSEDVIARNPDVIIVPDSYMASYNITVDEIASRSGWSSISAVANGRIYFIDEDIIVRPGPRLVDGLEQLAHLIHPEAFEE